MPDMLVKLYSLPEAAFSQMKINDVLIRRPLASEKNKVISWIRQYFSHAWADECEITFSYSPISTYIAIAEKKIIGFASYNAACKNFFGPTGVHKSFRGKGIGENLLLVSLAAMKDQGYAYGIIGGAGPVEFYKKAVGAVVIDGSEQSIYLDPITG